MRIRYNVELPFTNGGNEVVEAIYEVSTNSGFDPILLTATKRKADGDVLNQLLIDIGTLEKVYIRERFIFSNGITGVNSAPTCVTATGKEKYEYDGLNYVPVITLDDDFKYDDNIKVNSLTPMRNHKRTVTQLKTTWSLKGTDGVPFVERIKTDNMDFNVFDRHIYNGKEDELFVVSLVQEDVVGYTEPGECFAHDLGDIYHVQLEGDLYNSIESILYIKSTMIHLYEFKCTITDLDGNVIYDKLSSYGNIVVDSNSFGDDIEMLYPGNEYVVRLEITPPLGRVIYRDFKVTCIDSEANNHWFNPKLPTPEWPDSIYINTNVNEVYGPVMPDNIFPILSSTEKGILPTVNWDDGRFVVYRPLNKAIVNFKNEPRTDSPLVYERIAHNRFVFLYIDTSNNVNMVVVDKPTNTNFGVIVDERTIPTLSIDVELVLNMCVINYRRVAIAYYDVVDNVVKTYEVDVTDSSIPPVITVLDLPITGDITMSRASNNFYMIMGTIPDVGTRGYLMTLTNIKLLEFDIDDTGPYRFVSTIGESKDAYGVSGLFYSCTPNATRFRTYPFEPGSSVEQISGSRGLVIGDDLYFVNN